LDHVAAFLSAFTRRVSLSQPDTIYRNGVTARGASRNGKKFDPGRHSITSRTDNRPAGSRERKRREELVEIRAR
jgi:hypothetical protein